MEKSKLNGLQVGSNAVRMQGAATLSKQSKALGTTSTQQLKLDHSARSAKNGRNIYRGRPFQNKGFLRKCEYEVGKPQALKPAAAKRSVLVVAGRQELAGVSKSSGKSRRYD